jgi:hypothetical protein
MNSRGFIFHLHGNLSQQNFANATAFCVNAGAGCPSYYKHLQRDKKFHYNPGRQHPEAAAHQVKTFISLEKFYSSWNRTVLFHIPQKCRSQAPLKMSFSSTSWTGLWLQVQLLCAATRLINCKRAECII